MAQELKVISDSCAFALWLSEHTGKFPRAHRYSLGTAIDELEQPLLALLIRAKHIKQRAGLRTRRCDGDLCGTGMRAGTRVGRAG
jgi:hypothetical protein